MIKRLTWFIGGAVAGVAGLGIAKKKAKEAYEDYAPQAVVKKATGRAKDAFSEGRRAMRAKESELKARLDGRVHSLADDLDEGDAVMVDGVPVEPGQVIVLKQVRDSRQQQPGRRSRA